MTRQINIDNQKAQPLVLYRYDLESERTLFDNAFHNDFSIVSFNDDESAEIFLTEQASDVTSIVLDQKSHSIKLSDIAQQLNPRIQTLIIHQDLGLDTLVKLLESGSVNRCFEKPYDPNLLRSEIYTQSLGIHPSTSTHEPNEGKQKRYAALIVDDEVVATKFLKKQLTRLDCPCEILVANNAEEALDTVMSDPARIAMIISDQRMPGMKGNQLLNEIQRINPHIVRMLTSAYEEIDIALSAVNESKIFRYIKKPWQADQINQLISLSLHEFETRISREIKEKTDLANAFERIISNRKREIISQLSYSNVPQAIIEQFFEVLTTVKALPPNHGALRAVTEAHLEEQLVSEFITTYNATKLARVPASNSQINPSQLASTLNQLSSENSDDKQILKTLDQASLDSVFFDHMKRLLAASGQNHLHFMCSDDGDYRITIKMFRHMLSAHSQIMPNLIEQQTSLLYLLILVQQLPITLSFVGNQHSLEVHLRITSTSAEGD